MLLMTRQDICVCEESEEPAGHPQLRGLEFREAIKAQIMV